jgi:hypothetical protein
MSWTHDRARVAALKRHRSPDDPVIADATRDLAAARLTDHVQRVVDAAPKMTAEQRDKIAALLRTPGDVREITDARRVVPLTPGGAA